MSNIGCGWMRRSLVATGMLLVGLLPAFRGSDAVAQESVWSDPVAVSDPGSWSWFPDLAIDVQGTPHVIWCHTEPRDEGGLSEQVVYASYRDGAWEQPNDIVSPSPDIVRNAIAADRSGGLHMLFGGSVRGTLKLYYQHAAAEEAWSAGAWSRPHVLNQGVTYMGDIGVDSEGVIHVVYDDTQSDPTVEGISRADVSYRRSEDSGQSWSMPQYLYYEPLTGSARPQMELDANDVIHVAFDEGWDRLSGGRGEEERFYGVYVVSVDKGFSWSEPFFVEYPESSVAQLAVGSDGQGGVLLVWRSMLKDYAEIFYQWSVDGGQTWGEPGVIPFVLARPWSGPFDMYDMATDSNGHIHLLVVGRGWLAADAPLEVYHLEWNGQWWAYPNTLFVQQNLYPEYPKISVHEGNKLHAVWFTREGSEWEQDVDRVVWYSQREIAAPYQPVSPLPTPTPEPTLIPTPTPGPGVTPTAYPQFDPQETGLPEGLRSEYDDLLQLVVALVPVAVLSGALVARRLGWFHFG